MQACLSMFLAPIESQESNVSIRVSDDVVIAPEKSEESEREDLIDKYQKLPPQKAIFLPKTGESSQLSLAFFLLLSGFYIEQLGRIEKEDH